MRRSSAILWCTLNAFTQLNDGCHWVKHTPSSTEYSCGVFCAKPFTIKVLLLLFSLLSTCTRGPRCWAVTVSVETGTTGGTLAAVWGSLLFPVLIKPTLAAQHDTRIPHFVSCKLIISSVCFLYGAAQKEEVCACVCVCSWKTWPCEDRDTFLTNESEDIWAGPRFASQL